MTLLVQLPPEVLEDISASLDGDCIIRLWMTGSKSLQTLLGDRGGVRTLRFSKIPSDTVSRFAWLKKFVLHCDKGDDPTLYAPLLQILSALPLQTLDLKGSEIYDNFFALLQANGSSYFPHLTTLSLFDRSKSQKHLDSSGCAPCWPKTLTFLEIGTNAPVGNSLLNLRLSDLPPHLTYLSGNFNNVIDGATISESGQVHDGNVFPENLLHLYVHFYACEFYWLHMLPVGLVDCYVWCYPSPKTSHWDWTRISDFKNLQSLQISVGDAGVTVNAKFPKLLPPSLTYFDYDMPEGEWCSATLEMLRNLPRNLTSLPNTFPDTLPNSWIPHLPRLSGELMVDVSIYMAHELPSGITGAALILRDIPDTDDGTTSDGEEDDDVAPFDKADEENVMEAKLIGRNIPCPIPLNLQRLRIAKLNPTIARYIPRSLTSLIVNKAVFTSSLASEMPKDLRNLRTTRGILRFGSDALFAHLPRSLHSLEANPMVRLILVGPFHKVLLLNEDSAALLPPKLECLELGPVRLSSTSWFSKLPRTLKHLRLDVALLLTPEDEGYDRFEVEADFVPYVPSEGPTKPNEPQKKLQKLDWPNTLFPQGICLDTFLIMYDVFPPRSSHLNLLSSLPAGLKAFGMDHSCAASLEHSSRSRLHEEDLELLPNSVTNLSHSLPIPIISNPLYRRRFAMYSMTSMYWRISPFTKK